jgi:ribosomal protein S18 acetylase RimI-like enzyme
MEDRPSSAPSAGEIAGSPPRRRLRLTLTPQAAEGPWPIRELRPEDAEVLGALMYQAYRGTVDDEGETLEQSVEEARGALGGKYGELLTRSSFVIEADSKPVSVTLVTLWEGRPLLAFLLTHPDHQGQGMGTYLVRRTIAALLDQGFGEVDLFVTRANEPAVRIYERLGFQDVKG